MNSAVVRPNSGDSDLVPGRSCQDCTLCCKLLEVEPLAKPRAQWCGHCDQKRGCRIYEARPAACQSFYCGYRRLPQLDERWKPAKAKFLINYESGAHRIVIHVDPVRPGAWRVEPYYSTLKQWARRAASEGGTVLVWTGPRATLILPGADKELGEVRDDQFIVPVERMTPAGAVVDFEVADANDPRVACLPNP
ncbi:MAG: hypothetical protein ABL901_07870 [Hyphomicrobiaceae bacterium]